MKQINWFNALSKVAAVIPRDRLRRGIRAKCAAAFSAEAPPEAEYIPGPRDFEVTPDGGSPQIPQATRNFWKQLERAQGGQQRTPTKQQAPRKAPATGGVTSAAPRTRSVKRQ